MLAMTRRAWVALDVLFAIVGLALFVYADLTTSRGLRLAAVVVLTIAIVIGVVLSVRRNDSG
ncbi:MAG TPA: hypothetical protein VE932_12005 [Patescibacteria group bacterium]|nr:hypothetical protein [Patescibacteria group bacterium]